MYEVLTRLANRTLCTVLLSLKMLGNTKLLVVTSRGRTRKKGTVGGGVLQSIPQCPPLLKNSLSLPAKGWEPGFCSRCSDWVTGRTTRNHCSIPGRDNRLFSSPKLWRQRNHLTFRNLASCIQDGRKITLQMPHFIFIQQISVLNILNMLYNLHFFLFKMPFIS